MYWWDSWREYCCPPCIPSLGEANMVGPPCIVEGEIAIAAIFGETT